MFSVAFCSFHKRNRCISQLLKIVIEYYFILALTNPSTITVFNFTDRSAIVLVSAIYLAVYKSHALFYSIGHHLLCLLKLHKRKLHKYVKDEQVKIYIKDYTMCIYYIQFRGAGGGSMGE